jgi:hypothetical protein
MSERPEGAELLQTSDNEYSKLRTDCKVQHDASLQCILDNYENKKVACIDFFEDYKRCRKEEQQRNREANRGRFWG